MSQQGAPNAPLIMSDGSGHQVMDTDLPNRQVAGSMQVPIRQPLMHSQLGSSSVQVPGPPQSGLRPVLPSVINPPCIRYAAAVSSTGLAPMVSSNTSGITPNAIPTNNTPEIGRNPNVIPSPNCTPEVRRNPNNLAAIAQMTNIECRTVRLVCPYEEGYTYSREEVLAAIIAQGVAPESIEGLGRMEKNCTWEVLFYTEAAPDKMASLEVIRTAKDTAIKVFLLRVTLHMSRYVG